MNVRTISGYTTQNSGSTSFRITRDRSAPPEQDVVVLIHGLTSSAETILPLSNAIAEEGFIVLTYDLYGRGNSETHERKYDTRLYNQQLLDLLQYLDISYPFHVVGYSFGACVAGDFASENRARVRSLTMLAPPSPGDVPFCARAVAAIPFDWLRRLFSSAYITLARLPRAIAHEWKTRETPRFREYTAAYKRALTVPALPHALASTMRNHGFDANAAAGGFAGPTFLMFGRDDGLVRRRRHPQTHLTVVATLEGMHMFPIEGAEEVATSFRKWVLEKKI